VFLALVASASTHLTAMLASSLLSFFAAFLTLIAFAIDIALLVHVHNTLNDLKQTFPSTHAGAGTFRFTHIKSLHTFFHALASSVLLASHMTCRHHCPSLILGKFPAFVLSAHVLIADFG
jgi:hypothetical protein